MKENTRRAKKLVRILKDMLYFAHEHSCDHGDIEEMNKCIIEISKELRDE